MKIVNRLAYRDYEILETLDAGLQLLGAEAKSIRGGRVQLGGAFVRILQGEMWLINMNVPHYEHSGEELDESRTRKLLMTRGQIKRWEDRLATKGMAIVPVAIYTKRNLVKMMLGLGKGKREFEKREKIQKREWERDVGRKLRGKHGRN